MADDDDTTTPATPAAPRASPERNAAAADCYSTARQSLMAASQRVHDIHSMGQLLAGISESPDVLNGYADGVSWLGGRLTETTDAVKVELDRLIEMVEQKTSVKA